LVIEINCYSIRKNVLGTHLFVKISRPGGSEGIFSVFESSRIVVIIIVISINEISRRQFFSTFQYINFYT